MRDYLSIGSSPCNEDCAQVGTPDFPERSRKECWAFIHQLERVFTNFPEGCYLGVKSFDHDFGTYREVVCYFDDQDEVAAAYAYNIENNTPATWDEAAREELGIKVRQ